MHAGRLALPGCGWPWATRTRASTSGPRCLVQITLVATARLFGDTDSTAPTAHPRHIHGTSRHITLEHTDQFICTTVQHSTAQQHKYTLIGTALRLASYHTCVAGQTFPSSIASNCGIGCGRLGCATLLAGDSSGRGRGALNCVPPLRGPRGDSGEWATHRVLYCHC